MITKHVTAHHDPRAADPHDGELPVQAAIERLPLVGGDTLEIATIPLPDDVAGGVPGLADLAARAAGWIAAAGRIDEPTVSIPLYGTHLLWSPRRAALLAPPQRLPAMREAVAEFAAIDAELRDLERGIGLALAGLDDDAPLAFEFGEAAMPRRRELADRYRRAIAHRRRLAVVAPAVHRPAPQPPTFAGQLGERLRDRTRIVERLEHATEQADLAERVYTSCGDRASDFLSSRRHATLEWVIILLLAAELVVLAVDLLASGR